MIVVLSPSKTLDFDTKPKTSIHSTPEFLAESEKLIKVLRRYSPAELSELMGISDKLAMLNAQRYQDFQLPFTPANARQALLAFKGDVYTGMEITGYGKADFTFAQQHLRILSGLYGLLRPLDLIQPYRLEMGTRLPNKQGKDLYAFWGRRITQAINEAMAQDKSKLLINLASEEYAKAIQPKVLDGEMLTIVFKENTKGTLKIVGLFAKRARGMMADFIIQNRIKKKDGLKAFNSSDYRFEEKLSTPQAWVFVR